MLKYKQVYLNGIGKTTADFFPCEVCNAPAVDIHHIDEKGMGGRSGADVEENLIGLCRCCHDKAHTGQLNKAELKAIVWKRLNSGPELLF